MYMRFHNKHNTQANDEGCTNRTTSIQQFSSFGKITVQLGSHMFLLKNGFSSLLSAGANAFYVGFWHSSNKIIFWGQSQQNILCELYFNTVNWFHIQLDAPASSIMGDCSLRSDAINYFFFNFKFEPWTGSLNHKKLI